MFASACPPRASALAAVSARFAVSAFFALATESPGASLLTWFLAMFLTCFFSFLLRMLLIAVGAAIAVPANATIRASAATIIAGDGRRPFELVIETPFSLVLDLTLDRQSSPLGPVRVERRQPIRV